MGDSQLVIKWLTKEYKCSNPNLLHYYKIANALLQQFAAITIIHIPREENEKANDLV